ncbi:peptidase inhibitor family I36 protein [Saccharopolyspora phatthalungensis]|uniref:Peptidase inhibitor family I36 n=1 Tax=Saccharopolyspora phatthalungensis TaxID=664693 RepID=A0A840PTY0_9PSEU|nr:peptidase inhibitor family I36 protein [Saccharopolyspora phatthalungensis]MBB5153752.1 hypothetical protein [Saccharopolyspora phatthalungensis]
MFKYASSTALNQVVTRPPGWRQATRDGVWRMLLAAVLTFATILVGAGVAHADPPGTPCPAGSFCSWPAANFAGKVHALGVQATAMEQCVRLQQGIDAQSFVNNTGHPVTVYQDPNCDTEAEFATYPTGSQAPQATFVARAIKIWSH